MGTLRTTTLSILLTAAVAAVLLSLSPAAVSASAASKVAPMAKATAAAQSAPEPATPPRDYAAEERELKHAHAVLAKLQAQYEHLDEITLRIGPTPDRYQAVAYYTDGEIVISPDHVASIEKILAHEVWHIIDWRDNGRLDWGEDLPPDNYSDYHSRY